MQAADTEGTQPQCRGVDMGLGGMPLGVACKGGELTGELGGRPHWGSSQKRDQRACCVPRWASSERVRGGSDVRLHR